MDWLHDLDDVVCQFHLCFFHACAATLGGAGMKKARVKLANWIVKIMLSRNKRVVERVRAGVKRKGKGYNLFMSYCAVVSGTISSGTCVLRGL